MLKKDVTKYFGSQRAAARALRLSDAAVSQWKTVVPERVALKLNKLTNGKLEYNPSIYSKTA